MNGGLALAPARVDDLAAIMTIADRAFDPAFGEAWTPSQMLAFFALPSAWICLARDGAGGDGRDGAGDGGQACGQACGFAAARIAGPESELLLLAVDPDYRRRGIATRLIAGWQTWAAGAGAQDYFLEMRADNDAIHLYENFGFAQSGRRVAYYCGVDGVRRDAITMFRSVDET